MSRCSEIALCLQKTLVLQTTLVPVSASFIELDAAAALANALYLDIGKAQIGQVISLRSMGNNDFFNTTLFD